MPTASIINHDHNNQNKDDVTSHSKTTNEANRFEKYKTSDYLSPNITRLGKACEMSDAQTGKVIKVFYSISQAEKESGESRAAIGKVCRQGGGIVGRYHFRSVSNFRVSSGTTSPSLVENIQNFPFHTLMPSNYGMTLPQPPVPQAPQPFGLVPQQIPLPHPQIVHQPRLPQSHILGISSVQQQNLYPQPNYNPQQSPQPSPNSTSQSINLPSQLNPSSEMTKTSDRPMSTAVNSKQSTTIDSTIDTNESNATNESNTMKQNLVSKMNSSQSATATSKSHQTQTNDITNNNKQQVGVKRPLNSTDTNVTLSKLPKNRLQQKQQTSNVGVSTLVNNQKMTILSSPTRTKKQILSSTTSTQPKNHITSSGHNNTNPTNECQTFSSSNSAAVATATTTNSDNLVSKVSKVSKTRDTSPMGTSLGSSLPTLLSAPRGHFDVTKLKPIAYRDPYTSSSNNNCYIQLHCKGLKVPIVNFMNVKDAADSLMFSRSTIKKMCEPNASTLFHKDGQSGVVLNTTFLLSYLKNNDGNESKGRNRGVLHPSAYLYGSHHVDTKEILDESYYDRMKRFKESHVKDLQKRVQRLMPTTRDPEPTNEVKLSEILNATNNGKKSSKTSSPQENNLRVTPLPNTECLLNVEYQGLCILCQESKASIILNPCQHCLYCKKCITKSSFGKKFCPVCRTSITSTTQVSYVKYVRPR